MMDPHEFETSAGVVIVNVDDEDDYTTHVSARDSGEKIGKFEFRHKTEDFPPFREYLKLTWAYLDWTGSQYKRKGIGEEILRLVKDISDLPIYAEEHDGNRQSDGSHLTQDAPKFIERMREKGLISGGAAYHDDEGEW